MTRSTPIRIQDAATEGGWTRPEFTAVEGHVVWYHRGRGRYQRTIFVRYSRREGVAYATVDGMEVTGARKAEKVIAALLGDPVA